MSKRIDLTGKRFGALTAVSFVPSDQTADHRPGWKVRCDCGNVKIVNADNLRRGLITSCGCGMERGRRVAAKLMGKGAADVTGQTWNELTAVSFVKQDTWLFRCSCGKEVVRRLSSVRNGEITSCGHLRPIRNHNLAAKDGRNVFGHVNETSVSTIEGIVNGTVRSTNTSGATGVRIRTKADGSDVYVARITFQGKNFHLGTFDTMDKAIEARKKAEEELFKPQIEEWKKTKKNRQGQ